MLYFSVYRACEELEFGSLGKASEHHKHFYQNCSPLPSDTTILCVHGRYYLKDTWDSVYSEDAEPIATSQSFLREDGVFSDGNVTIGPARAIGPFIDDQGLDDSDSIYLTSPSLPIAFKLDSKGPMASYKSKCGKQEILFAHPEDVSQPDTGFRLIDEHAPLSSHPVVMYRIAFEHGPKADITNRYDFQTTLQAWSKNPGWGTLFLTQYQANGNW